jgi:uncharacterized membrane protein YozB (DUF420 family)
MLAAIRSRRAGMLVVSPCGEHSSVDAKLVYWTGAFINMGVLAIFATRGVLQVRRGEIARHKRSMTIAATLVAAFVISYAFKVILLGKEDLSVWSSASINTLRFHELCVLVMLIAGGFALYRGLALRKTRLVTHDADDPLPEPRAVSTHRLAGRVAVCGAILGLVSAGFVLASMFERAG